ncbi:MAG: endonuclease/exonuclease/phosphatase family protein [Phycisphaerales bacterium]|nr:endonuclease/exonuclease/phosphatase family protein [Phycisphaerales bacterium]
MRPLHFVCVFAALSLSPVGCADGAPESVRVMTFNLEDVSGAQLEPGAQDSRVDRLVSIMQRIEPDILFVNELAYDFEAPRGENASRLASRLMKPQAPGLPSLRMVAFSAPPNTGVHSGHDLDNNGTVATEPGSRSYGGDCLGYGEYPGQYGMALLVSADLEIRSESVRTFRDLKWKDMPGALLPTQPYDDTAGWYSPEELAVLPLSSKSHWDIPVLLPDGRTLHVLCSHPTPPVFDGPEDRNGRRNHDEIRFWAEYINGADWIVDDAGQRGGLAPDALFVIVGDLNADPDAGDSLDNPIGSLLLKNSSIRAGDPPLSRIAVDGLSSRATSRFRLRVDYVLPSRGLEIVRQGVWRGVADSPGAEIEPPAALPDFPTDHFPVWVDIRLGKQPPESVPDPE